MRLKKRSRKKLLVIGLLILSLAALLLVVNAIFSRYAKPWVISYLKNSVHRESKGLYTLEFDKLRLNLVRRSIRISELNLRPDTALYHALRREGAGPPLLYDLHSDDFEIRGIHLLKLWRRRQLELNSIQVDKPAIQLLKTALPEDTLAKPFEFDPYQLIAPAFNALLVKEIRITDGRMHLRNEGRHDTLALHFKQFGLEIDDLYIDSLSSRDTSRAFYSNDLRLRLSDFNFGLPDSMYTLHVGAIGLSSKIAQLSVDSFRLEPRYGETEFHKIMGRETDRLELKTGKITISGFDLRHFLRHDELQVNEIAIEGAMLTDFLYNFKVDERPYKKLPHLALKRLDFPLDIQRLSIQNSTVIYRERPAGKGTTGQIKFSDINGVISNISNLPARLEANPIMQAKINASFMGMGSLAVKLDFHMDRDDGYFTVDGSLGRMPMEVLNRMTETVANVKIKRGTLQKMTFDLQADSSRSRGNMGMYYNGLNIELLPGEDTESNMKAASILTNLLLVNSNNPPPDGPLRRGVIAYRKPGTQSIFGYLWKSLLSGIKSSVGVSAEKEAQLRQMAEMFMERKERREARREARQERRQERRSGK